MSLRQILYFNYHKMASPETFEKTDAWRYESSEANFNHSEWGKAQLENWLSALQRADLESMFEKHGDKIRVNADGVKNYLTDLSKKSYNDIWRENWGNTIPQTTAIQIALEMQGIEVWAIDWIYWKKTTKGIKEFQTKWNAEHPQDKLAVDGKAGPKTIQKLLEGMDTNRSRWEKINWWLEDAGEWWRSLWR